KVRCWYERNHSRVKLVTNKPKNITGPTKAVEIAINTALSINTWCVTRRTSTPKLTALSLSNHKTSNTRCRRNRPKQTNSSNGVTQYTSSTFTLLKLANILDCTDEKSFGSISM